MINIYSQSSFKACRTLCDKIRYEGFEDDDSEHPCFEYEITEKFEFTEEHFTRFKKDTSNLFLEYCHVVENPELGLKDYTFLSYLWRWGEIFPRKNKKIYIAEMATQCFCFSKLEHCLSELLNNRIPPLLSELLSIWEKGEIREKYWILMPRSGWSHIYTDNLGYQFLCIKTPPHAKLSNMLNFSEAAILYFKNSLLRNIGKYIDKYTSHKIVIGRYGSVTIESECSSLLALYFLSFITTWEKDLEKCLECGNPLQGRERNYCSAKCKDKHFNKTPEKRVDRWINRKVSLGQITEMFSKELREEAKTLFEDHSEEVVRIRITKRILNK